MTFPKLLRRFYLFRELHRGIEFERLMRLLKANNGTGAMTEAMWLLYEEAHYSGRYSGLTKWRMYLNKCEGEASLSLLSRERERTNEHTDR